MYKKNVNRNFWIDLSLFVGCVFLGVVYFLTYFFSGYRDLFDFFLAIAWLVNGLIYGFIFRSTALDWRVYRKWKKDSNLVKHMERELALVTNLDVRHENFFRQTIIMFAELNPSGGEAGWVVETLRRLMGFENLTPTSNNPNEWVEVGEDVWQSIRNPTFFSEDGGRTYYDVDDPERSIHLSEIDPLFLDVTPEFTEFREYAEKDVQMMQKLYEERENTDD